MGTDEAVAAPGWRVDTLTITGGVCPSASPTATSTGTASASGTPSATATANASGTPSATATASASGTPSASATATASGTPFPSPTPTFEGNFVIGDLDAVVGNHVTFFSPQWANVNHLSGGTAPTVSRASLVFRIRIQRNAEVAGRRRREIVLTRRIIFQNSLP
jgi:hypothetical protein